MTHALAVRVYYEDTDFSGLVYHAAHLHFFERGRTEFLRELGVHHSELVEDDIAFAVRRLEVDYLAAARIDDLLEVTTDVDSATGARLNLRQAIRRGDVEVAQALVQVVAVRIGGGAARLPRALLERLRQG